MGIRSMMDMLALEQRLASLENKLVEAQRVKQNTVAQLSRQDRLINMNHHLEIKVCNFERVARTGVMQGGG